MKIENYKIQANSCGGWLVIGDTERFGEQEILYESPYFKDCVKYLKENGCEYTVQTEILKVTKVQIGCSMFHRVYKEGEVMMGYNNRWGWEKLKIEGFELIEPLIAKRKTEIRPGKVSTETLKLGRACTW